MNMVGNFAIGLPVGDQVLALPVGASLLGWALAGLFVVSLVAILAVSDPARRGYAGLLFRARGAGRLLASARVRIRRALALGQVRYPGPCPGA